MRIWMSAAMGSLMLVGTSFATAEITDDPAQVADQVFRNGVAFCNSAAKVSRTDTKGARRDFNQYLSHFERAQTIFPPLLNNNTFAEREHHRCSQIGDDIARAEALPIIEHGLTMCQEAKTALGKGQLELSRARFSQYEASRDRALRQSESVLKVGSTAVQVRLCNGLTDKIAALEKQNNSYVQMARGVISSLTKANTTCAMGEKMLLNGQLNPEKQALMAEMLIQTDNYVAEAKDNSDHLNRVGSAGVGSSLGQINALQGRVAQCRQALSLAMLQVAPVALAAPESAVAEPAPATSGEVPVNALVTNTGADL